MKVAVWPLFLLVLLTGCATNKPLLLSSPMHYQIPVTITPSVSVPEPGFHPYLGLTAGLTNNSSGDFFSADNRTFSSKNIGLNTGLLFQPDLQKDSVIGFFGSVNATGMFSSCSIAWNRIDISALPAGEKKLLSTTSTDFTSDLTARLGLVGKMQALTLACYLTGFTDYENGKYTDFRKDVNEIEYFYNRSNKRLTSGYGIGFDLSLGQINQYDFGVIYEMRNICTATQSYESSEEDVTGTYIVSTVNGGVKMTMDKMKIEPYFDYGKIRLSCAINASNVTFGTTCRW